MVVGTGVTYFGATIKEVNGEHEYYHDLIIEAHNFDDALDKANSKARNWYEDDEYTEEEDDIGNITVDFTYLGIAVRVDRVYQTTIKEWCRRMFEEALVQ